LPVYSVSQVTRYLKDSLEADALLGDLWVRGEVSNLSHSAAGHYYFTLKDATNQMRCVMFRPAHGGENLADGGAVSAHGRVSLYGFVETFSSMLTWCNLRVSASAILNLNG